MYAVIETGGKQYRVATGDTVRVETLQGEKGSAVEFTPLAVIREAGDVVTGDSLSAAKVKGTIANHGRADKVLVFKFKRKKQYKRTIGHRQNFTAIKIEEISA